LLNVKKKNKKHSITPKKKRERHGGRGNGVTGNISRQAGGKRGNL